MKTKKHIILIVLITVLLLIFTGCNTKKAELKEGLYLNENKVGLIVDKDKNTIEINETELPKAEFDAKKQQYEFTIGTYENIKLDTKDGKTYINLDDFKEKLVLQDDGTILFVPTGSIYTFETEYIPDSN